MVKEADDENVMKMWHYLNYVDVKFNMFDKYPDCDAFINVKVVSVNSEYRNSQVLINCGKKMYAKTQFDWYYGVCSSLYSAKAGFRVGFKEVFTLPYTDYVDAKGKQILFPDKRHDATRVVVLNKKSDEAIRNYHLFKH
jgi:arylalkylamine N-acetyltransferase